MQLWFGEHTGKSLELVILKEPAYVRWMLGQTDAFGRLRQARKDAQFLIQKFDKKPLVIGCNGQTCSSPATGCSVDRDNVDSLQWWCARCSPYQLGAVDSSLHTVATYQDAIHHVEFFCNRRASDLKTLIRALAIAKGLPKRVGEQQAQKFLN